jgi:hypothetical protein
MKAYNWTAQASVLVLTVFLGAIYSSTEAQQRPRAEAQQVPSSAVACYFVGRGFLNTSGQGEVVGYFTDINGIGASDTLFSASHPPRRCGDPR